MYYSILYIISLATGRLDLRAGEDGGAKSCFTSRRSDGSVGFVLPSL